MLDKPDLLYDISLMKTPVSLALSQDVREALDSLAERHDLSRSWLANRILREGLASNAGTSLPVRDTASVPQQQA